MLSCSDYDINLFIQLMSTKALFVINHVVYVTCILFYDNHVFFIFLLLILPEPKIYGVVHTGLMTGGEKEVYVLWATTCSVISQTAKASGLKEK